ncbi:DUF397 domain-containing protein [Streptomyces sp. NBC_00986]|uniref:DUF397 domain-containing protein n=1 Tax=Streptomyces sp. NBC_00986 TaxID=2903702 RepID=UPI00386AB84A|nr:DUF397 domain-containing protein [Streptomyces sp. NBC_00986]
MRAIDLNGVTWRKSSYSNTSGGECVEVASNLPLVPVRDSKNPDHGTLIFGVDAWSEFVGSVKGQAQ